MSFPGDSISHALSQHAAVGLRGSPCPVLPASPLWASTFADVALDPLTGINHSCENGPVLGPVTFSANPQA